MMGQGAGSAYATQQPTSFWQRNWKWIVPVGCLGMLMALFAFVGIVLVIVFGAIKSSEPVQYAYRTASADARVHAVLGEPVEEGWLVSGNVNSNGPTGSADLSLPVSGPKGSGTLYVVARKQAGQWQYSVFELEVEGKYGRINLLGEPVPADTVAPAPQSAEPVTPEPVAPAEPAAGGTYNTP